MLYAIMQKEPQTAWGIYENRAAGDYFFAEPDYDRIGHYELVHVAESEEAARAWIANRNHKTRWAVFFNHITKRGYISAEGRFTGNWRGSRNWPDSYVADFATEEEARGKLRELMNEHEVQG